jgi:hypothetical protein
MNGLGRLPLLGGLATGGRGRLLGPRPPALEGTGAGDVEVGVQQRQADADEAGPPGGVGLAQKQGLLDEGVSRGAARVGRPVLRRASFAAVAVELLQQVLHGTRDEVQATRDGAAIESLVVESSDALAHGPGNGSRHDRASSEREQGCLRREDSDSPLPAQNDVAELSAKLPVA